MQVRNCLENIRSEELAKSSCGRIPSVASFPFCLGGHTTLASVSIIMSRNCIISISIVIIMIPSIRISDIIHVIKITNYY